MNKRLNVSSNINSDSEADANYDRLTRLQWCGVCTDKIEWKRDGDSAVAKFGYCEDATGFVFGYLNGWLGGPNGLTAIKKIDTPESIRLRDRLREEFLPKKSLVDQIEIPERQPWGVPVTIKIPLAIINTDGLQWILEAEERQIAARSSKRASAVTLPAPR